MNMRASSEQKRAYRQTAMEAAKAEQLAALEAAHRRLVAFERSNALYNKTGVEVCLPSLFDCVCTADELLF